MRKLLVLLVPVLTAIYLCATSVFALAFLLPDSDQRTCYQDVSPYAETPCAGTGQDGAYSKNPLSYTNNGNGTVTDNNTGLVWQKEDDGNTYNWYRASGTYDANYNPESTNACGSLNLGGATDWRLPSKKELISIVDYAIPYPGPTIHPVFTNTKASDYWSCTSFAYYPDRAWFVTFDDGYVYYSRFNSSAYYVRCVRGGQ